MEQEQPAELTDKQRQGIRFGEFLAALDALDTEELANALFSSQEIGIPLGRTLVVRGLLTNEDLGRLLEFHGLYRRGLCDFGQIKQAFSVAKKNNFNVKEALESIGCPVDEIESVRLGELLLAAGLTDVNQLNSALSLQKLCGLPLGRVLVIHMNVPEELVDEALHLQREIRQKTSSYAEAVDKLKLVPLKLQAETLTPIIDIDLRDLLVAGKICTDRDLEPAINFAVANNLPLEQVLCSFDWIDPKLVSAALGLSKLIESGYISAQEAVGFLSNREENMKNLSDNEEKLNLHKFLLACGYLSPHDVNQLTKLMVTNAAQFSELVEFELTKDTTKEQFKEAMLGCFEDDNQLAEVLIKMFEADDLVITHARNMVDLVKIGGASLEQAILSFASLRRDVAKFSERHL